MKKLYILLLLCSFIGFSQTPGDLIITEILQNPPGTDGDGEYFEIYNTTAAMIDINGWIIRDNDTDTHTIDNGGALMVPAGAYITLGRNGDTAVNGGITHAYIYGESFFLGNSSDEVVIEAPGAVVIDEVIYDNGATFPDPNGPTMQLDASILNNVDNDLGSNWCESSVDYGTPGAANETCAATCETDLGAFTADCDSVSPGTDDDTYTITLAYTGAATGETFVVSTTPAGLTVGGDDPTAVADGTITITGVQEGTDVTISVSNIADGGLCDLSASVMSPVCVPTGSVDMELQGVLDFSIPGDYGVSGGQGKAVHVVVNADIADLSEYGLGIANNGGGTDGEEYTFPAQAASSGDHILVVRSTQAMQDFMTMAGFNLFDHVFVDPGNAVSQNGDDAIELFKNGTAVEVFGDVNVDGTGEAWEYLDTWAYKDTPGAVWPTGWIYGALNCTDFPQDTPQGSWTINDIDPACVYPFLSTLSNDNFTAVEFDIYPNPVNNGIVNIISNNNGEKSIELFDVLGRNVMTTSISGSKLDVSSVEKGMYLIRITIENSTVTQKLIIN